MRPILQKSAGHIDGAIHPSACVGKAGAGHHSSVTAPQRAGDADQTGSLLPSCPDTLAYVSVASHATMPF